MHARGYVATFAALSFVFLGASTVFAQESNGDMSADKQCPSEPSYYVYVSGIAYGANVYGKVNLYGKLCTAISAGDVAAQGICVAPNDCKANLCDGKPCQKPPGVQASGSGGPTNPTNPNPSPVTPPTNPTTPTNPTNLNSNLLNQVPAAQQPGQLQPNASNGNLWQQFTDMGKAASNEWNSFFGNTPAVQNPQPLTSSPDQQGANQVQTLPEQGTQPLYDPTKLQGGTQPFGTGDTFQSGTAEAQQAGACDTWYSWSCVKSAAASAWEATKSGAVAAGDAIFGGPEGSGREGILQPSQTDAKPTQGTVNQAAQGEPVSGIATQYNPFKPGERSGGTGLATGGTYDPNSYSAAIQTDIGRATGCGVGGGDICYAKVVNNDNGKTLIVQVNDNGPLSGPGITGNRIIDLNQRSMDYLSGQPNSDNVTLKNVTVTMLSGNDYTPGPAAAVPSAPPLQTPSSDVSSSYSSGIADARFLNATELNGTPAEWNAGFAAAPFTARPENNGTLEQWNAGFAAAPFTARPENNGTPEQWNAGFAAAPYIPISEQNGNPADWTAGFAAAPFTARPENNGTLEQWNAGFAAAPFTGRPENNGTPEQWNAGFAAAPFTARPENNGTPEQWNAGFAAAPFTARPENNGTPEQWTAGFAAAPFIPISEQNGTLSEWSAGFAAAPAQNPVIPVTNGGALSFPDAYGTELSTLGSGTYQANGSIISVDAKGDVTVRATDGTETFIAKGDVGTLTGGLAAAQAEAKTANLNEAYGTTPERSSSVVNPPLPTARPDVVANVPLPPPAPGAPLTNVEAGIPVPNTEVSVCTSAVCAATDQNLRAQLADVNAKIANLQAQLANPGGTAVLPTGDAGSFITPADQTAITQAQLDEMNARAKRLTDQIVGLETGNVSPELQQAMRSQGDGAKALDSLANSFNLAPNSTASTFGDNAFTRGVDAVLHYPQTVFSGAVTATGDLASWAADGFASKAAGTALGPTAQGISDYFARPPEEAIANTFNPNMTRPVADVAAMAGPLQFAMPEGGLSAFAPTGALEGAGAARFVPDVTSVKPEIAMGDEGPVPVRTQSSPAADVTVRTPEIVAGDEGPVPVKTESTGLPDTVNKNPALVAGDEGPVVEPAAKPAQPAPATDVPSPTAQAEQPSLWQRFKDWFNGNPAPAEEPAVTAQAKADQAAIDAMNGEGPAPVKSQPSTLSQAERDALQAGDQGPVVEKTPAAQTPPQTATGAATEPYYDAAAGRWRDPTTGQFVAAPDTAPAATAKAWNDPALTQDEFISQYKARYPNTSLSDAELADRYAAGQRLNPDTGRLKVPDTTAAPAAAPATPPASFAERFGEWKMPAIYAGAGAGVAGLAACTAWCPSTSPTTPEAAPTIPKEAPASPAAPADTGPIKPITLNDVKTAVYGSNPPAPAPRTTTVPAPEVSAPAPTVTNGGYNSGFNGFLMGLLSSLMQTLFRQQPNTPVQPTTQTTPTTPTTPTVPIAIPATTTTPAAVVTLIAHPTSVPAGGTALLAWSSVGTRSCSVFAPGNTLIAQGTDGTTTTPTLSVTADFLASCLTTASSTIYATTTVTVQ
jgi:rare lipoprotein A (peptidoglycan hydrolase)